MTEPKVAIVVPTRDRPSSLEAAIRSVVNQTFEDWELWIVDDGSLPPVELPPDLARLDRIRLLRNEVPMGPGAARNAGVRASESPYVAFLDDDDRWMPDKLAKQMSVLEPLPESVGVVECGYAMLDGERTIFLFQPSAEADIRKVLLRRPRLQPSTIVVRRDAFDAVGGFPIQNRRAEDWMFALALCDDFEVATVAEPLVVRSQSEPAPRDMLDSYRRFVADIEGRIAALEPKEERRVRALHICIEGTYLLEDGDVKGARSRFVQSLRRDPIQSRAAVHLLRSFIGETNWGRISKLRYSMWRALNRIRGRGSSALRRW